MATPYKNAVGKYSDANFTILREQLLNHVQGPASATDFAHFASRNIVIVRAVHVWVRSACSATAGSLHFCRSSVTITSKTVASMGDAGTYYCITLTTNNTLHTITEVASLRVSGACDKGEFDVLYEYQVIYPSTHIGT